MSVLKVQSTRPVNMNVDLLIQLLFVTHFLSLFFGLSVYLYVLSVVFLRNLYRFEVGQDANHYILFVSRVQEILNEVSLKISFIQNQKGYILTKHEHFIYLKLKLTNSG